MDVFEAKFFYELVNDGVGLQEGLLATRLLLRIVNLHTLLFLLLTFLSFILLLFLFFLLLLLFIYC
jgi:hypothetical protein